MLGLLLIYFIGKHFADLATEYNKKKWQYAILGIATYYAGTFVAGVIIAIIYELFLIQSIDDISDLILGLMAMPFGILSCVGVYYLLKKNFKKNKTTSENNIQDIGSF
ncbi:MAG: hypothetical protein PSN34_01800 [Urechidicola sp.]|nr:hypothetical protein [Urechidicola sp.]